jgi:hypothetical protein
MIVDLNRGIFFCDFHNIEMFERKFDCVLKNAKSVAVFHQFFEKNNVIKVQRRKTICCEILEFHRGARFFVKKFNETTNSYFFAKKMRSLKKNNTNLVKLYYFFEFVNK